ncbi:MAG: molybdopterin oxidoreductase [Betaproteobacteria bacterium RIFCSPLOWO2_02_FULL_63_19]|nr:MAG: molybdopterin oxidoreductase [Betaproteobacteria bacterium RIFCSPLOWO2_02_FULL_63_19]
MTRTAPGNADASQRKVSTFCYQCVNGPDLLSVDVHNGVATAVEPNFGARSVHPADGKVCVKAYGLVQKLYNPHRVLRPMKRTNPKKGRDEDPGWQPISWDEALETIAARLRAVRETGLLDADGQPRVAFTTGGAGTPIMYMGTFPAFFSAWGPVDRSLGAGGTVKCTHAQHMFGELWHRAFTSCPDTPRCRYVVSFGTNIEVAGGVTGVRRQADARARGCRRVQIEPQLSVTGACSGEWLPIRPMSDAGFLYAMLNVLLHEHSSDELDTAFLRERTAAPYLVGPHGYYLRDPETRKPLVWDTAAARPVPFDAPGIAPALEGEFELRALEIGADDDTWMHERARGVTAHTRLANHVAAFTPEWAAPVCDLPAATIRRIANEFLAEARIGGTIEIDGVTLPLRPVAITLGRSVNSGLGAYECVWARTVLQVLVGALEVPGGLLGTTVLISGEEHDRIGSVRAGPDGFLDFPINPTDREHWAARPKVRHAHETLLPLVGAGRFSQALGSSTFGWMRMQDRAAETWPRPRPPDVWFVYRCNPAISFSETDRLEETIATFPFTVAFAYTLDETNHYADLLLPDATDLESLQLVRVGGTHYQENFWEHQGWVLRQPVVAPRGEAKDFSWIATELALRCGLLEAYVRVLNEGGAGLPLKGASRDFSLDVSRAPAVEEIWDAVCRAASAEVSDGAASDGLDWYREHGYRLRPFAALDWFLLPAMCAQGLRFELPYGERILRTGEQLRRRLHEQGIRWWDSQAAEYTALPAWRDIERRWARVYREHFSTDAAEYPFWLLTSRSMQYAWGGNVGIQLIREVARNVAGHEGILMNRGRAAALGVDDGDAIEVRSPIAAVRGRAVLREGVRPDTLVMLAQFGHWKTPFAKDFDTPSLNRLVPMNLDLMDGGGSSNDAVKVSVRRVRDTG